ncbi:MAG TPA: heavy-metal-associated domain-containing protein [Chitinophagales bacterium]|nr:heavy-metal-associated domain-containing protein [Chitinophagales bacterium]
MKINQWVLSIMTILLVSVSSFAIEPGQSLVNLKVKGMRCGGCEAKVKSVLKDVKGIVSIETVDASEGKVSVVIDDAKTSDKKVATTLADKTGYDVKITDSATNSIKGNTKAACCSGKSKADCKKK